MTKYRVALNKDRTMWFSAGVSAPAETYIDIEWAETVAQQLRHGCYPDAHVVEVQPEPEPKYRSPMRLQRDQLREELKRAWDAIPPGIASRSDSVSAAVAKLAKAYEASQEESAKCMETLRQMANENDQFQEKVAELSFERISLKAENAKLKAELSESNKRAAEADGAHRVVMEAYRGAKADFDRLKAQLAAKPEPVTPHSRQIELLEADRDACIREAMAVKAQRDSLAAENAKLKAQIEARPEPVVDDIPLMLEGMRYQLDRAPTPSNPKGWRSIDLDYQMVERWHDTMQAVAGDLVVARESLKQCLEALPEELRGGSVPQGIASLIRSRTYAREQASQYATRCTKAEQERDEAREKLEELERANYKAWSALPHDVKVRGGYLAGRIIDMVRDLEVAVKERDEARAAENKLVKDLESLTQYNDALHEECDALQVRLSKKNAAIAKALEL